MAILVDRTVSLDLNPHEGHLLLNQRGDFLPFVNLELPELKGHVLLQSSGVTGKCKLVALSFAALRHSAEMVNRAVELKSGERWAVALSTAHVAGMSILNRCRLADAKAVFFPEAWSPQKFYAFLKWEKIQLTSLVPTQIHDLVSSQLKAPESLRAVMVGGDSLSEDLYLRARNLGWPLLPSYGLSEAASTVALAPLESLERMEFPKLRVLDQWKIKIDEEQRIAISGPSLFSFYLNWENTRWERDCPIKNSFFTTQDRGRLEGSRNEVFLEPFGRCDRVIKHKGQMLDLDLIEKKLKTLLKAYPKTNPENLILLPIEDSRLGHSPCLVALEAEWSESKLRKLLREYKQQETSTIGYFSLVSHFPRSSLGKIRLKELDQLVKSRIKT